MSQLSIPELRTQFSGQVIAPDDTEYDTARTVVAGGIDRRPAVIIRPADAAEVAQVIRVARESGHELAVRSGGHSGAGHSVSEGGVVLDLTALKGIEIDAEAGVIHAQTGLTAGQYTTAAAEHGLATGFGDTGSVGIGGITLGGGVGYLSRKYGLTVDDLLGAEIVTADGQVLEVDADNHPDLFWAIRGGGGNFGVATRFTYRAHRLDSVVGGILILPATPEVVHGFVTEAADASEDFSAIVNVMPAPPMPFIPAEQHGKLVVMGLVCYAGSADAGEKALAPFRALATPLADMVRPISYPEMYPPEPEGYHPTAVSRTLFADTFDAAAAELVVSRLTEFDAPMRVVQLRVLGGAISRVPAEATAYAHRDRNLMLNVAAFYEGADDKPAKQAWVEDLAATLHNGAPGAYVNFLSDDGPARIGEAYPSATQQRLAEVKRRYDPTNLFRLNQNVAP